MLWMAVVTWSPEKRDEWVPWLMQWFKENPLPKEEGEQQIWWDINHNRYFELIKRSKPYDPKEECESYFRHTNLCHIEKVPVLEIKDVVPIWEKGPNWKRKF